MVLLFKVASCADFGYDLVFAKRKLLEQVEEEQEAPALPCFILISALVDAEFCLARS